MQKLVTLKRSLEKLGFSCEACKVEFIIKLCSMPGIDFPTDEIEIEGIARALKYLDENPGKFIFLDNPKGSRKRFGQKNYKRMPFHYGEFTEVINPSDDMGWDVVVVPSARIKRDESMEGLDDSYSTSEGAADSFQYQRLKEDLAEQEKHPMDYISQGHNFVSVGYVPVNDDQAEWTKRTKSPSRPEGKPAPVGNDKIILAPDGVVTDDDKRVIEEFFGPMWNFKDVIWL